MDYPVTKVIIEHLLEGLSDNQARRDTIASRVAAAIAKLPEAEQRKLTVDRIFEGVTGDAKLSPDLRKMLTNPALKNEPRISQLRRAESAYIEAHDAHRKDPANGRLIEEMRWAHVRLQIARRYYDGLVTSLPSVARAAIRPATRANEAIKPLRLAAFNGAEQRALRLAITDRPAAIEAVDAIISAGQASSRDLLIVHAYLIDPDRRAEIERWLIEEMKPVGSADSPPHAQHPDDQNTEDLQTHVADEETPKTIEAPLRLEPEQIDAAAAHAIVTLEEWLRAMPFMLTKFAKIDGRWVFTEPFKSARYSGPYALVADHPAFQRLIEDLKTGATLSSVPQR